MSYFGVEVCTPGFKNTQHLQIPTNSIAGKCFRQSGDHWKYSLFSRGFVLMGKINSFTKVACSQVENAYACDFELLCFSNIFGVVLKC